jgi:lysozyme
VAALAVIGAAGWSLTTSSEGLRTKTYRDPVGIPTVCYGHTGPDVHMGQVYTEDQCNAILIQDIRKHQKAIIGPTNCIRSAPLTPNQRDALTDFIINVGTAKFCKSTLAAKISRRDYRGASAEFAKWEYAGGRKLPGLVQRREGERDLFLSNQRSEARDTFSSRATSLLMSLS